ncbi:hypothetical protein BGX28_004632 [Mortierella sp. GBA30]|nr:hypothetical protein BGX28_004632 [Mortierella sp. GBA30]
MPRKRHIFLVLAFIVQLSLVLMVYVEPLYLISRSKLDISGTLKERLSIVIASNRVNKIQELKDRTDFFQSTINPYTLEGREFHGSSSSTSGAAMSSSEDLIKTIYIEGLKLCNKVYCMILDDDVVFIYKDLKDVLFDSLISYNNDNNYVFDCSKRGFLRYNYKVNGNGSFCRIYSRYATRHLIECLPACDKPVDVCLPSCLEGFEEKRFLLTQHAGFVSSRW